MKFGVTFGSVSPKYWIPVAQAADLLGYESVWLPEHLVLPVDMTGSPFQDADHPPIPPETPVYEPIVYLSHLAAMTSRVRLGTYVYLLGIRHPFVSARGWATLDIVSGGRATVGVGAGWLTAEWESAGLDPRSRGRRLDEAIGVCRSLWTEAVIEHHGEHFDFGPVAFEPKPLQRPLPIHVGGESPLALERAGSLGDGWLGMAHTPTSAASQVARLRRILEGAGRSPDSLEVTVSGPCDTPADLSAWEDAGVDRLIVRPWARSADAVEAMNRFADTFATIFRREPLAPSGESEVR